MSATAVVGQEGASQLGVNFMLGGPPVTGSGTGALRARTGVTPQASTFLASTAPAFIAHVLNTSTSFKATLAPLPGQRPTLKWSLNAGFDPIVLEVPSAAWGGVWGQGIWGQFVWGGPGAGDLIYLTEQGGDGSVVYTGIIETITDVLDSQHTTHQIALTPLVAELGDTPFNKNYTTATDVAQMVRDAVAHTNHCAVTPLSCPNTGVTAINNFNNAKVLDVLDFARKNAGSTYFWFCDQQGIVWLQPQGSTPSAFFGTTVKRGPDTSALTVSQDITALRNSVLVVGGTPSGTSAPITGTYNGSSQSTYGKRFFDPPPSYPDCLDQTTLNQLANTIGSVFDRIHNRVEMTLPSFGKKVIPNQPGGPMVRVWAPNKDSLTESTPGSGNYSSGLIALSGELDGIQQKLVCGDIPVSGIDDLNAETNRILRMQSLNALTAVGLVTNPDGGMGGAIATAASGKARWFANATSFGVNDGTRNRIEIGNLGTYTDPNGVTSPAGYHVRVLDASGNLVNDGSGLINTTTPLLNLGSTAGGTQGGSGTLTWTTLVSGSFTLSRRLSIRIEGLLTAYDSQVNAIYSVAPPTQVIITGQTGSQQGSIPGIGSSGTVPFGNTTMVQTLTLPAGTYTANLQWVSSASTDTLHWQSYGLIVTQLGS